jgi:uncharacterized membrane protein
VIGLGLSFVVIVGFVVPAILRGHSPVAVAVTGAMAIMLISLYLSHGTGPKTTAAVVGTALARGLLLAGIIIGGLGVLDDVTMSQASLVSELHQANPTASSGALVGGALRVGRDHIAATVNTCSWPMPGPRCRRSSCSSPARTPLARSRPPSWWLSRSSEPCAARSG